MKDQEADALTDAVERLVMAILGRDDYAADLAGKELRAARLELSTLLMLFVPGFA